MITVSAHAAQRFCERVNPALTPLEAVTEIRSHARVVEIAARFGCSRVKLHGGARLVLDGDTVVTVLSRQMAGGRA
jgi:hypothetical protein